MRAAERLGLDGLALRLAAGVLFLATLLCAIASPDPALAHAALVGTDPADGALLAASPTHVTLTFSEPVSPLVLKLVGPDGAAETLSSFKLAGETVEIENPRPLAKGTHVLSWRVVSADGHPVGGSLVFSVGAKSTAPAVEQGEVDWSLRSAMWLARVLLYTGLFLGVGGAFCLAWLAPPDFSFGRLFSALVMLAALPAAALSLGLQGLDALELPLSQLPLSSVWQTALGTSFSWTVAIALAALALGLVSLALPRHAARVAALAGLAGVGAALAASGHASDADPQWLTRPMVFLHGAGIAIWTGALAPLALAFRKASPDARSLLLRFSGMILPVVAVLVLAGIVLAVIQVEEPAALVETAYGRLLVAKLVLLVVLFGIAALNRWRLTVPAGAGDGAARSRLVGSIGVEILLVATIFGVAAGWRFTPPPRALAIAAAQPVSAHFHTAQAMAEITLTPGRAGPMTASIVVTNGVFEPLDPMELTLVLAKPDTGIEPMKRAARKAGDGTWRVDGLIIPMAGEWTIGLDILVSDFDMVKIAGPIDIRP